MRAVVITVSTSRALAEDSGGDELERFAEGLGAEVIGREIVPDDRHQIAERLRAWSVDSCDVILTTGGTGFSPTDVTPEATRDVIDREAPGLGEAIRAASREHTGNWMLSRGVAGTRGQTLIVNFPGNPKSISQAGAALAGPLRHAVELLGGHSPH